MIEILYLIVLAFALTSAYGAISAAPWVPTKAKERCNFLDQLPLKGDEKVYDLGCGTGSLLFAVAERYPGVTAIGYDVSLLPLCIGWVKKFVARVQGGHKGSPYANVHLKWRNLFTADIHDADLVFIFLMPKAYAKLAAKFSQELPLQARVAVEAWPIPAKPIQETISGQQLLPVYIYAGTAFRVVE